MSIEFDIRDGLYAIYNTQERGDIRMGVKDVQRLFEWLVLHDFSLPHNRGLNVSVERIRGGYLVHHHHPKIGSSVLSLNKNELIELSDTLNSIIVKL